MVRVLSWVVRRGVWWFGWWRVVPWCLVVLGAATVRAKCVGMCGVLVAWRGRGCPGALALPSVARLVRVFWWVWPVVPLRVLLWAVVPVRVSVACCAC